MTRSDESPRSGRPGQSLFRRRTWTRTGYLLATLPVGIFWFATLITLISVGLATIILWIGLPILWFAFVLWRRAAVTERRFIAWGLGISIPTPYRSDPQGPLRERRPGRLGDPATWRDLAYLILLLPLGILWFTLTGITLAIPLGLLAAPVTYRWFPDGQFGFVSEGWTWLVIDSLPGALVAAGVGLLLLLLVPAVIRSLAAVHGSIAAGLLGPTRKAALVEEVRDLQVSRARGLSAAEFERQRIERNLHDGAQQQLVALAMELGMAREKLDTEPGAARRLVDRAHQHAKQAIIELRDLARGIHPAVLSDRGLDAALSALAGQSTVPVEVTSNLTERLPAPLESTAYFVAAEALANAAKHAGASAVSVSVHRIDDRLTVEVEDDGVGGADAGGNGLRGLADRVAATGGELTINSPEGGPTIVKAEVPCGS